MAKDVNPPAAPGPGVDIMEQVMSEDKPLNEQIALKFSEIVTSSEKRYLYRMHISNAERREVIIALGIANSWYRMFNKDDDDVQEFINELCYLTVSENGFGLEMVRDMIIGLKGGINALMGRKPDEGLRRFFPH